MKIVLEYPENLEKLGFQHISKFHVNYGWSLLEELGFIKSDPPDHFRLVGYRITNKGKPYLVMENEYIFVKPDDWPKIDLYSLADAVVLFQSKSGERGSMYTPLATVELKDLA